LVSKYLEQLWLRVVCSFAVRV